MTPFEVGSLVHPHEFLVLEKKQVPDQNDKAINAKDLEQMVGEVFLDNIEHHIINHDTRNEPTASKQNDVNDVSSIIEK